MTFQFRSDVERMSHAELIDYVNTLEAKVDALGGIADEQAIANLIRAFGLTRKEAEILVAMADGRVHTKTALMAAAYAIGADDEPEIRIIDVFVCKLRRKVAGSGVVISTVWGSGYFVAAGVDTLTRAMAGGPVEWDGEIPPAVVGRPAGAASLPKGQVRDKALAWLRERADGRVVRCTAKQLSDAIGGRTGGSGMIANLEKGGWIGVMERPGRAVRGGVWTIVLTDKAVR